MIPHASLASLFLLVRPFSAPFPFLPRIMSTPTPSSSASNVEKADTHSPSRVMTDQERGYARIPNVGDQMATQNSHSSYRPDPPPGRTNGASSHSIPAPHTHHTLGYEVVDYATSSAQEFWDRLRGKGRRRIGWGESVKNIVLSSCECDSPFAHCIVDWTPRIVQGSTSCSSSSRSRGYRFG